MLTGRPPFDGENTTDVLARVIEREPDFERLPSDIPAAIRRLVRRTWRRNRTIGWPTFLTPAWRSRTPLRTRNRLPPYQLQPEDLAYPNRCRAAESCDRCCHRGVHVWTPSWSGADAGAFLHYATCRCSLVVPGVDTVIAVSPDGRRLAYSGRGKVTERPCGFARWTRSNRVRWPAPRALSRPSGLPTAGRLAFSPTATEADGRRRRVGHGAVRCRQQSRCGLGSRLRHHLRAHFGALQRVSASGGIPSPASVLAEGEVYHSRPHFLPGTNRFIYRVDDPSLRGSRYFLASLDSMERTLLSGLDSGNVAYRSNTSCL